MPDTGSIQGYQFLFLTRDRSNDWRRFEYAGGMLSGRKETPPGNTIRKSPG